MNINITPIVEAVILLLSTIITIVIIPLIRRKVSSEKLAEIEKWVRIAVGAADQLLKGVDPDGSKRKAYVLDFLASLGLTIEPDRLDAMIEAEVLKINLKTV